MFFFSSRKYTQPLIFLLGFSDVVLSFYLYPWKMSASKALCQKNYLMFWPQFHPRDIKLHQETSSLCFNLSETHIDRAKSLRCWEKQNQASLVYYSTVSSPLIKRESNLCYFPKICSNTNSSKTRHLQDLTHTGVFLSPLRTIWTSKSSCLSLPWIKINTRRNLAKFCEVSFARSLVSSRNSSLAKLL